MTCRKRRYRSELDAKIALASTSGKRAHAQQLHKGTTRSEVRFYRCPDCRGWHLTSEERLWT